MSRFTQVLVDLDVGLDEAPSVGQRVLEWLQSTGIVVEAPSDNAAMLAAMEARGLPLSPHLREHLETERGWSPGPAYERWVDDPDPEGTRTLSENWFTVDVGRNVHAFPADDEAPRCPEGHEGDDAIVEAVDEWYDGDDPSVHCDACGRDWPITRWDLGEGMALGNLGLRFENWGILSPALVEELQRLLAPHATKLVVGKI